MLVSGIATCRRAPPAYCGLSTLCLSDKMKANSSFPINSAADSRTILSDAVHYRSAVPLQMQHAVNMLLALAECQASEGLRDLSIVTI